MASPKSQLPANAPASSSVQRARSTFHIAYLLIWTLMVLSAVGAYGLDNGSTQLLTAQLAVLGALGVGAFLVWTVVELSKSDKLALVCYPLLYLWAVLCYAVQDERFIVRCTHESYSGSTASAALPVAVLFLFLPGAIRHRFTPCLISGLGGLILVSAFQIAGLRANSGLAETSLALLSVLFTLRNCHEKRNFRQSFPANSIIPVTKADLEYETWGLAEETNSPDLERIRLKLQEVFNLLGSLLSLQGVRDAVRSVMTLVQEAGKELSALGAARELGSAGLVSKAVESQYRLYLEERFHPVQSLTSKPTAHSIQYGGEKLVPMLGQLEKNWNFDMFFLAQLSGFRVLEVTGQYCVKHYALDSGLQLNETRVLKFWQDMERKYKPNPYHNSTHAADVLNSLLFIYKQSDIFKEITELELFGSIVAALGHDVGHPAFTNRYLVSTRSQFAMMCKAYADNDASVLENMHSALTYELLNDHGVLDHLPRDQWINLRSVITEMILATDMTKHFILVEKFKEKYANCSLPMATFDDKVALYKMCMKCADIGHAGKTVELHHKWSLKVVEEFFHQGDLEREQNLPISMFCDRQKVDLSSSQSEFIQNLVKPLFRTVNNVVRSSTIETVIIEQLEVNRLFWRNQVQRKKRASVAPSVLPVQEDQPRRENSLGKIGKKVVAEENL